MQQTPTKSNPERKVINANASPSEKINTNKDAAFPYPDCWQDDERMDVLMAPFRLRSVNPEHYDSKMKFWQDIIAKYCEHKGSAIFNKQELQLVFARGHRVPLGLNVVLDEMMRTKKIRLRNEYEYDPENSWTGWAINSFVKKPLAWGVYKIKSKIIATDDVANAGLLDYVHLAAMKKFCIDLQTKVFPKQQQLSCIVHYEDLKNLAMEYINLSEECLNLCLHTINCQSKIGLEYKEKSKERQMHLIKIPSKTNDNINITETDHAIHNLQITKVNLLKQLETLEEDIKANEEKARLYLQENKRQMAKTYLRKKHLLEKNHEKRSMALHNIEMLMCSVDEAQSNGEILDAYKIGSKALQNALNQSGLKYDNVDEVISEVRETIDQHKEIQDTLANANLDSDNMTAYDNDDLERELQEILGEKDKDELVQKVFTDQSPDRIGHTKPNSKEGSKEVHKIQITDAQLLAMLDGLDVEDRSPSKSDTTTHSTIRH